MTETRRTYCGLCHPRCGLVLEMENGRAVKVTGDPEHPITRGRICNRGKLMLDHVYHPNRLNHPLKRKGERGAGGAGSERREQAAAGRVRSDHGRSIRGRWGTQPCGPGLSEGRRIVATASPQVRAVCRAFGARA